MTTFLQQRKFFSDGTVTDGYDLFNNRTDGVDILFAADVNNIAVSIQEIERSLLDGYAVTKLLANAVSFQDGQTLVYNAATTQLVPGASGDASFKIQSVTNPNAVLKSGYLILNDGRELNLATDTTVNLTTAAGGGSPADGYYYLYVDLNALPAATTVAGRKIYAITAAMFSAQTITPESDNLSRYVPIGLVNRASASWSSSNFATLAVRRHEKAAVAASPLVYSLTGLTAAADPNGTKITHNANVPVANQNWHAIQFFSDGYVNQLDNSWIINLQSANVIEVDFSFLGASDTANIYLENAGITATVAPTKTYDSGYVAANTLTLPITHGLGAIPTAVQLQHDVSGSGDYENVEPANHILVNATQITGSLAAFGSDKVRIIASLAPDAVAVNFTTLSSNVVTTVDNTFALGAPTVGFSHIYASSGTAALPSYTFSSDVDTGMYLVSEDVLGFSTNGTKIAQVDSYGAWTLSRNQTLTVGTGSLTGQGGLTLDSNVANQPILIFNRNGVSKLQVYADVSASDLIHFDSGTTTVATASQAGAWSFPANNPTGGHLSFTGTSNAQISAKEGLSFNIDSDNNETDRLFQISHNAVDGTGPTLLSVAESGEVLIPNTHNNGGTGGATAGAIASGTYTPTITNGGNISSSSAAVTSWMRVGNVVTVAGTYDMNTTSGAGTSSDFSISLPTSATMSSFSDIRSGGGVATTGSQGSPTSAECVIMYSNPSSHNFTCNFKAFSTSNRTWAFTLTYRVV